jgi:hypothetical protein
MKYFKSLIIVSFFCILILALVYRIYKNGYERFYSFEYDHLNEIVRGKLDYDILFLGSSRTYYQVNPKIIDSVTNLNSYNAGLPGANLLECKLVLQCYLYSHRPPKMIVVDIAENAFDIKKRPFWNPTIYYPFLNNPVVFDALKPYEHVYLLKYLPFVRFVEADDMSKQNSFLGYFQKKSVENKESYKGYLSFSSDTIALPFKRKYPNISFTIEPKGVASLEQIATVCRNNNIKLIFTFAPVYDGKNLIINPDFFPTIEKVSSLYNIHFWNYKNHSIWNNHKLFVEELHLNPTGVNLYSRILAQNINELSGSNEIRR